MSAGYRFYLLKGDHIVAVKACEYINDADALLEAGAFLQDSIYHTVEVWNGSRWVSRLNKPAAEP